MPEDRAKRPRDPNQLAKFIVDVAIGDADIDPTKTTGEGKDPPQLNGAA